MSNPDPNLQDENAHLSPALRARLQKCYEFGNQKLQIRDFDYANEMFQQCFLGNPRNIIYLQSFVVNLRLKYGDNKKGASFAAIKSSKSRTALKLAESRSKWVDVIKLGVGILVINPWDASTFLSMGKAALALGYDMSGLALIKHAVDCDPTNIETNRYAAQQLGEREKYADAIACLQRILNVKQNDHEASRLLGDLMLRQTMAQMETKKIRAQEETEDEVSTRPKLSEEDLFEKKLSKTPEDRDLWIDYADYFFQKKNLRKVEDTYKRALKVFPEDADLTLRFLEVQKIRAREEVVRAQELNKKNPSEDLQQRCQKLREDYEKKSLALIQHKLKLNPSATQTRYEYGVFLLQHSSYKEAIVELQAAQQDESIKPDCILAIAFCFEKLRQYKLAMTHYEKAIRLLGESSGEQIKSGLYNAARLAAGLGDFATAEQYANRLAGIDYSYKNVGDLLDKISKRLQNG